MNILHRSFLDPSSELEFNGRKFPDLSSLQASRPAGLNYQSFSGKPKAEVQEILSDLLLKKVVRKLTPREVNLATFSPLGYAEKPQLHEPPKKRLTFHWLRNSQYRRSPVNLASIAENGDALSHVKEGYIVDLKSYYWQLPLDYESSLSCGFAVNDGQGDIEYYGFQVLPFGCRFMGGKICDL